MPRVILIIDVCFVFLGSSRLCCEQSIHSSTRSYTQNNNRGGYNKGDVDDTAATDDITLQYDMQYYQSEVVVSDGGASMLSIEWTNQHGCGGNEQGDPHKLNCDIILQYMAVPVVLDRAASASTQYVVLLSLPLSHEWTYFSALFWDADSHTGPDVLPRQLCCILSFKHVMQVSTVSLTNTRATNHTNNQV